MQIENFHYNIKYKFNNILNSIIIDNQNTYQHHQDFQEEKFDT